MAGRWPRHHLLLLVALAVPLAVVASIEEAAGTPASALVADDECVRKGGDAECGLNALQFRREKLHALSQGPTEAGDVNASSNASANDEDASKNATNATPAEPVKLEQPFATCGGDRYHGSGKCVKGYVCAHMTEYYAQCKPEAEEAHVKWKGGKELKKPSDAPLMTFYMYRAMGKSDYKLENLNAGTLGGIMWYIHNEVVSCIYRDCVYHRRFGIDRIRRFKVHTKAPGPLYKAGMNFGIRYAFDSGQCTGPWDCEDQFDKWGFFVGCNNLSAGFPFPTWPVYYNGTWFSLPGSCPERRHMYQSFECKKDQPGGLCDGPPTGTGSCTYSYEQAGEIFLDDLEGIKDYEAFKRNGGEEFNLTTDEGTDMTFWNGINNTEANAARVSKANELFMKKYPDMPGDHEMPAPACDFDMDKFFPHGVPTKLNKHNPHRWE